LELRSASLHLGERSSDLRPARCIRLRFRAGSRALAVECRKSLSALQIELLSKLLKLCCGLVEFLPFFFNAGLLAECSFPLCLPLGPNPIELRAFLAKRLPFLVDVKLRSRPACRIDLARGFTTHLQVQARFCQCLPITFQGASTLLKAFMLSVALPAIVRPLFDALLQCQSFLVQRILPLKNLCVHLCIHCAACLHRHARTQVVELAPLTFQALPVLLDSACGLRQVFASLRYLVVSLGSLRIVPQPLLIKRSLPSSQLFNGNGELGTVFANLRVTPFDLLPCGNIISETLPEAVRRMLDLQLVLCLLPIHLHLQLVRPHLFTFKLYSRVAQFFLQKHFRAFQVLQFLSLSAPKFVNVFVDLFHGDLHVLHSLGTSLELNSSLFRLLQALAILFWFQYSPIQEQATPALDWHLRGLVDMQIWV